MIENYINIKWLNSIMQTQCFEIENYMQNKTRVVLRLSSNTAGNSNDSSFLHTLLLNHGQDGAFKSIF